MESGAGKIIQEAKEEAARIIKEAEDVAGAIYGASLEYADDMLSEVNLTILRGKELMRLQMESILEEFDAKADILAGHKQELLELLQEHTNQGAKPIKKSQYEIKIDESYMPKKAGYEVKIKDGAETKVEAHKPAKAAYEIKIADEWKDRIENMLEAELVSIMKEPEPEPEPEEEAAEGEYSAEDFDLDGEYFNWLEEKEEK